MALSDADLAALDGDFPSPNIPVSLDVAEWPERRRTRGTPAGYTPGRGRHVQAHPGPLERHQRGSLSPCGTRPMISGRDLYAAAALLIREHGEEARSIARRRANELRAAGNEAGYAAFTRIAGAVRELGQVEPAAGATRH